MAIQNWGKGDCPSGVIGGAIMGAFIGLFLGLYLMESAFPVVEDVPVSGWLLYLWVVVLSTAFGAFMFVAREANSELRNLRSYVGTFFYFTNHQASVDKELQMSAIDTYEASKRAIGLRTKGVVSYGELDVEDLSSEHVLEKCRRIQEDADRNFHREQARFYQIFDLAAKFMKVFSLNLKARKFKEYLPSDNQ